MFADVMACFSFERTQLSSVPASGSRNAAINTPRGRHASGRHPHNRPLFSLTVASGHSVLPSVKTEHLYAQPVNDSFSRRLRVFLAFREEGFLRRTFERFSTAVHSFRFARFLLAFLKKALLRRPRERLAVRAPGVVIASF
jgi:hypothetical protein